MEEYALLGGGGLAIEIAEYMLTEGYHIGGYYAPEEDKDCSSVVSYLGDEREDFSEKFSYIVASGLIDLRKKMIGFIESHGLKAGTFISKHAYVSALAKIGKGAVIAPFSVVAGNPHVGDYLLMNQRSGIGHHATVGNNVVVGPGAQVSGHCRLGSHVTMGTGAALIPGTVLENETEIGILTYPAREVCRGKLILASPGYEIAKKS